MPVDTRAPTRFRNVPWRRGYAGLVAALTFVGLLFATWDRIAPLFKAAPVNENAEVVLDRSAAMDGPFEGGTRWQAAVAAVDSVLASVSTRDNLALRQFGGPCDANNT